MEIVVTGRRMQVNQKFRDVVETKMNRVTSIAPDTERAQIVVTNEGNPRQANIAKRVEITVEAGAAIVRAEASSSDEYSALDLALDKLIQRLRRIRDRRKDHRPTRKEQKIVDMDALRIDDPVDSDSMQLQEPRERDHRLSADLDPGESIEVQLEDTPIAIRRKLHVAEPMTIEEALYEMELIGHDFFLFVNSATGRPSVVYRRHGWSYGVFEIDTPENIKKSRSTAQAIGE